VGEDSYARKCACWLAFAFVSLGNPSGLGFATVSAAHSARDCVGFERGETDKELRFHASNSCERRLECTMDYTLSCEDLKGQVTSSSQLRLAFQLTAKGEHDLTLSAVSCKQGWRIGDVTWNCF
jgi:hypothetical protein